MEGIIPSAKQKIKDWADRSEERFHWTMSRHQGQRAESVVVLEARPSTTDFEVVNPQTLSLVPEADLRDLVSRVNAVICDVTKTARYQRLNSIPVRCCLWMAPIAIFLSAVVFIPLIVQASYTKK